MRDIKTKPQKILPKTKQMVKRLPRRLIKSAVRGTFRAVTVSVVRQEVRKYILPKVEGINGGAVSNLEETADAAKSTVKQTKGVAKAGKSKYTDCSHLAWWAYKQAGVRIPSTSVEQAKYCADNRYLVGENELQPGDLIFWQRQTATVADEMRFTTWASTLATAS